MFVLCPHCEFLVSVDPRTGQPPPQCPKCGQALESALAVEDVAPLAPSPEPPPLEPPSPEAPPPAAAPQGRADAVIAAMSAKPARKPRGKPRAEPPKPAPTPPREHARRKRGAPT